MHNISINVEEYYYLGWQEWLPHIMGFGIGNMEISLNCPREHSKVEEVLNFVRESKVKVSALHDWFHFFSPNEPEEIRRVQQRLLENIEHARSCCTDRLVWYTGGNDQFVGEKAVHELLRRLEPVLKKAEELNVTLLLETEFSKGSKDPAASIKLLRKLFTEAQTPYLACNFDAANLYVAGEEPFPYAYEELKPWIHYVHIKDVRRLVPDIHSIENMKGYLQEGMIDGVCCAIGEGAVNYAGLLEALKADGYDGYLGATDLHGLQGAANIPRFFSPKHAQI